MYVLLNAVKIWIKSADGKSLPVFEDWIFEEISTEVE